MAEQVSPLDQHVGRRLRLRRSLMGLSQERLGELLGVSFQQIQKYERGANRIGSDRLLALGRAMNVPVAWFFVDLEGAAVPATNGAGLAEHGQGFSHDLDSPPEEAMARPLVGRRETLEVVRAFNRIGDATIRRRLYELTRALADAEAQHGTGDARSA